MKLKDNYPGGVCPDCRTVIPDDTVDGTECKNGGHIFHPANKIKYKVLLHWDDYRYSKDKKCLIENNPIREGDIDTEGLTMEQVLEKIFFNEQYESKNIPSASELDIIVLEDGRRFRILDVGFSELCSKDDDRGCVLCAKFYIKREDVPKAVHMNARNTFYKNGKHDLCEKCFMKWGIK
jgi:hypothetical protein